jgi:acetyl esterase/lipase
VRPWPPPAGSKHPRLLQRLAERQGALAHVAQGGHGVLARGSFELPPGARAVRDLAYGEHPAQRVDVYLPAGAAIPAVVLMVHGGGWQHGAKDLHRVIRNKVARWVAHGWAVVSADYRLLPEAAPLQQADDVARALAFVQRSAGSWGADPEQVVLIGHSSGGHLVSLLSADRAIGAAHGAAPWRASVVLDSAAFDVVQIMQGTPLPLHRAAFGTDPAGWQQASPSHRLSGPPLAPMLAVCSSPRASSCRQALAFAARAAAFGGHVEVLPVALTHGEVTDLLGLPGPYTDSVEDFLHRAGVPGPAARGGKPPSGGFAGDF